MARYLVAITGIVFSLSLLGVGLAHMLVYQPQWNAVMYTYPHLRNPNVIDFYMRQSWMQDLDTRLRVLLPFDYEDGVQFQVAEDGERTLLAGHTVSSATISSGESHLYLRNSRTGKQTILTSGSSFNDDANATADLRRIVFISARLGSIDVFTMYLAQDDTLESVRQITNSPDTERDPQWLTREQYHAYLAAARNGIHHIVLGEQAVGVGMTSVDD